MRAPPLVIAGRQNNVKLTMDIVGRPTITVYVVWPVLTNLVVVVTFFNKTLTIAKQQWHNLYN